MQNPRLASRYAKSLIGLAVERNSLEETLRDMSIINDVCVASYDFTVMLRSPVINADKKLSVIFTVMARFGLGEIVHSFIRLLVTKGREANLHEIAQAYIAQYNEIKNIKKIKLTTAAPISEVVKSGIVNKIAGELPGDTIQLETALDESLIGGFVLEMDDLLYDASIRKNLNDMKTKMIDYSYISKM